MTWFTRAWRRASVFVRTAPEPIEAPAERDAPFPAASGGEARGAEPEVREDRLPAPLPDPGYVRLFPELFRHEPEEVCELYGAPARRVLLIAARVALRLADEASASGVPLGDHLARSSRRYREAWEAAVDAVLEANRDLELQVRELAWALPKRRPAWAIAVPLPDVLRDPGGLVDRARDLSRPGEPAVIWWPPHAPLPRLLSDAAQEGHLRLVMDGSDTEPENAVPGVLLGLNSAIVERPGGTGAFTRFDLPASAGIVQAILSPAPDSAWCPVAPPSGFRELSRDFDADEEFEHFQRGRAAVVNADESRQRLVVSSQVRRKNPGPTRSRYGSGNSGFPTQRR